MQSITHCPACQTQFVVTELQLQQHNGTVRCGHCLHVFNATEHLVIADNAAIENTGLEMAALEGANLEKQDLVKHDLENNDLGKEDLEKNSLEDNFLEHNVLKNNVIQLKPRIKLDLKPADLLTPSELISQTSTDNHLLDVSEVAVEMLAPDAEMVEVSSNVTQLANSSNLDTSSKLDAQSNITHSTETYQYDYLTELSKPKPSRKISPVVLWIFLITLILLAMAQSVYFLRHQIALYYPTIKPSLEQICVKLGCSIDLPKKIESIVIDDSDIQEDAEHAGLMRLSTTLINRADFNQAYPNLELTLTDVDDKPKLRRIFKPQEYLPANTNIAQGLAAGEELKVKLAMTTQGIVVAGYRVFVTY